MRKPKQNMIKILDEECGQSLISLALARALLQAVINVLRNVGRNHLAKLLDVLAIDRLRETEGGIHDASIQIEEGLGHLRGSGVLMVERGDKGSGLARRVDLIMHAAHREDGALELFERSRNLRVLTSLHKPVLKDVAKVDGAVNDGKELGGTGMYVRSIDTASIEEA